MLNAEENPIAETQTKAFEIMMNSSIDKYDEDLSHYIEGCIINQQNENPSSAASSSLIGQIEAKSLAEAQLLSNYQLLNFQSQSLFTSFVPLLIEQTKLNLLQEAQMKGLQDHQIDKFELDKKVVSFAKELSPRLAAPFKAICAQFVAEAEQLLLTAINEDSIANELESQEISLLKQDSLKDELTSTPDGPEKDVLQMLQQVNKEFPIYSSQQLVKQSAIASAIDFDTLRQSDSAPAESQQTKESERQLFNKQADIINKLKQRRDELKLKLQH